MEWTPARPRHFQLINSLIHGLLPLSFKILGSYFRNGISLRIELITLVTGKGSTQGPSQPSSWTPARPEGGLYVVRSSIPGGDEDSIIFIGILGDTHVSEEIWSRESEVAQEETADVDEGGEEVGI